MNLQEQLKEDLKQAMRDKDSDTLNVLRGILSTVKNLALEAKEELSDVEVVSAIKRDVKKLQDALKDFTEAARKDLVEKTQAEIDILKGYLPPEMSDEDLEKEVRAALDESGITEASDLGKAMGAVMQKLAGKADGGRIREMVQKILN